MHNSNNAHLSLKNQVLGRRRYFRFTWCNGLSVTCLSESILILYALKNGAPDALIAVIASFLYIGSLCMLPGRKLIAKSGATKTITVGWALRYSSALLMLPAPFLPETWRPLALALVCLGSLGFFCGTSMGTVALQALTGDITAGGGRGDFTSRLFFYFTTANLIALSIIIFVINRVKGIAAFQFIILGGVLIGYLGTWIISHSKESGTPKESAQQPVKHALKNIWHNPHSRKLLIAWGVCYTGTMLVIPFSMLTLKNGYQLADYQALFFALIQLTGGISASYFSGLISEETGPRPLIIIYFGTLILICLLWVGSPDQFNQIHTALIFFLCGVVAIGMQVSLSHYFLMTVPEKERVGSGLLLNVTAGLGAGILGTVISTLFLFLLKENTINTLSMYRIYFLLILIILVPLFFLVRQLDMLEGWQAHKVLGLALAPREMRAFYTLKKLQSVSNPDKEHEHIRKLELTGSYVSEKKLLSYLDSPQFQVRIKAIEALRQIRISSHGTPKILKELKYGKYSTAYMAAVIAGEQKIKEAIPLLRKALHSEDIFLRGKALVALTSLEDHESYGEICKVFVESVNPRLIIHGAVAIAKTKDYNFLPVILQKAIEPGLPSQVRHEIINSIASFFGHSKWTYKFLKYYRNNHQKGMDFLLELFEESIFNPKEELINQINAHFHRQITNQELINFMHRTMPSKNHTPVSCIAKDFLFSCHPKRLYPELLYCFAIRFYLDTETRINTLS